MSDFWSHLRFLRWRPDACEELGAHELQCRPCVRGAQPLSLAGCVQVAAYVAVQRMLRCEAGHRANTWPCVALHGTGRRSDARQDGHTVPQYAPCKQAQAKLHSGPGVSHLMVICLHTLSCRHASCLATHVPS